MERLHSQLALAAFLQELGEAVEEAELVCLTYWPTCMYCWICLCVVGVGVVVVPPDLSHNLEFVQCKLYSNAHTRQTANKLVYNFMFLLFTFITDMQHSMLVLC